ncbi:MAG: DegV family protein [Anaerolineales bacterium]
MSIPHIVTDTTACLPPQIAAQYDIPIIPQIIHFGEQTFRSGVDLSLAEFMRRLRTGPDQPKTAAPPPEYFAQVFERLLSDGAPILCLHPSAEISGTVRSAQLAAQNFPQADIRVLDTRLIASPLGQLVSLAAALARQGLGADEIQAQVMALAGRARILFLVDTLDFLARGGRIGGAAALAGTLLQIKPILTLRDGKVEPLERSRTMARALQHLTSLVIRGYPADGTPGYLSILHADAETRARSLAADLHTRLALKDEIPIVDMPPAIVTHVGPGVLGAAFFTGAA